jgi:hypothetical protein
VAAAIATAGLAGAAPAASAQEADCLTRDAVLTVEEGRLGLPLVEGQEQPASQRFIEAAGLDRFVERFEQRLCQAGSVADAEALVRDQADDLWELAVARAQGEVRTGEIDPYDDRPLYWARVRMSAALRLWQQPEGVEVTNLQRGALVRLLTYASRGIDDVAFPAGEQGVTRVLVSGFDTYSLDQSLRNSNPSGASALQLDGTSFQTPAGRVVVEAVVFPVNWTDFDQGIVEDAFGPSLVSGDRRADLIMTISQTRRGRMDIEEWAGAFRGGFPDNNRVMQYGPISRPGDWPMPFVNPQWIRTTLPYEQMIAAGTGPWPVQLNDGICEWPAGTYPDPTEIRCQDDPSEGSRAAAAPGGNYLSNESMYRTNRLRQGVGAWDVPGGHLHISALVYPEDLGVLTDPAFEADRRAVVDQTIALVLAAGRAVEGGVAR